MKSIVVMSGGQDSTTVLGIAMQQSDVVLAITYDYGQTHVAEVACAVAICNHFDIPHKEIDLRPALKSMQSSALINHGDTSMPHPYIPNVPASFVPVRNALFLTVAYGMAMEYKAEQIYTGVCQTDYSGYPDCRDLFIIKLNNALDTGYESKIEILTPLMFIDKAETFKLAEDTGILPVVLSMTMTCYQADTTANEWGMGCGECPACKLRKKGWSEFLLRYHPEDLPQHQETITS